MAKRDVIVMGASAGGVHALRTIIRALPADLPAAVSVVMHVAPHADNLLARILADAGSLPVVDASDARPFEHGRVYVAPPDHHLVVDDGRMLTSRGPKENLFRPFDRRAVPLRGRGLGAARHRGDPHG